MPSSTREYLEVLASRRADSLVVTTMTSAKVWPLLSQSVWDVNYLPSAMSHASDMALGLAIARPERRVICVNGDGSLAMNLGSLITAVAAGARNLTQLVLANGTYQLVGGAPVPGRDTTDWVGLARAAGWPVTCRCHDAGEFSNRLDELLAAPSLVLACLDVVDPPDLAMRLPPLHPGDSLRELRCQTVRI